MTGEERKKLITDLRFQHTTVWSDGSSCFDATVCRPIMQTAADELERITDSMDALTIETERLASVVGRLTALTERLTNDVATERDAWAKDCAKLEQARDMLKTIAEHPDTPLLIKQYALGTLHQEGPP